MQFPTVGSVYPFTAGIGVAPGLGGAATACAPLYGQVGKACAGAVPATALVPTQAIMPAPAIAPSVQYGQPILAGIPSPIAAGPVAGALGKAAPFWVTPSGRISPRAGWGVGFAGGGWNPLADGILAVTTDEVARW